MRIRVSGKERELFVSLIAQHAGPSPADMHVFAFARRLLYYGATYGRIQEMACNAPEQLYGQDEFNKRAIECWNEQLAKNERKEKRIEQDVTELCARFGCKPIFQGDPRGNTIKIQCPDGFTNDWGKEGICVPTS